jgi:S1-C subfamily serine protease
MKRMRGSALIRAVVLAGMTTLVAIAPAGCASGTDARKRASLKHATTQELGGTAIAQFAKTHSPPLLTGADEVDHLGLTGNGVEGVFRLKGKSCRTVGGCAAVPIDPRGYWLTAAHCADSGAVLIHESLPDGRERGVPARIVWRGATPGLDLALLYAPLPEGVAPVQVARAVRVGEEVICVGSGIRTEPLSAGRVVGIGGSSDGAVIWLEHDAPLAAGDSGGPAFYRDGLLAGINTEAGTSSTGKRTRATAIQPNMQQMMDRINQDWSSDPSPAPAR